MPQYRKKPVVIEAIQWNSQENIEAIEQMLGDKLVSEQREGIGAVGYWVKTLEGDMMISYNDYIIKGIKGEFYPCKPDIFEASYELVIDCPEMKHPDPYPQADTVYTPSTKQ